MLSDRRNEDGAPWWMYVVGFVVWAIVGRLAHRTWRLSPTQLARRGWRASPRLHGRHHDKIDSRGVTWTEPAGIQTFVPWANVVRIRETETAFTLHDANDGVVMVLPKRGLDSPDLIPALRDFLTRSAGG